MVEKVLTSPKSELVANVETRADRAHTEEMVVIKTPDRGVYLVVSHGGTYRVDLENKHCACKDHEVNGELCKHRRRVAIEVNSGRVPEPGQEVSQDHCAYLTQCMFAASVGDADAYDRMVTAIKGALNEAGKPSGATGPLTA